MNAIELMRNWPGLSTATPTELLASPAWRLEADFDGGAATLRVAESPSEDELYLSITLDDQPHVLGLARSPRYADLDALWERRGVLPEVLVVALVEKECGGLLQFLENHFRQEVRLKGVASEKGVASRTAFVIAGKSGSFGFSLDLPAEVVEMLGTFDNLDPAHPAIASLSRDVRGICRTFEKVDEADLKEGDRLLLDDDAGSSSSRWETALPDDGKVRLVLCEPRTFTFADFANDAFPALPTDGELALAVGGTLRYSALPTKVGDAQALLMKGI